MGPLRYTLLADGAADRCLLPIVDWVMGSQPIVRKRGFVRQFADLRNLRNPPTGLANRLTTAVAQYPCEIIFIHRDAEGASTGERVSEIERAVAAVGSLPHIPLVPVRMTEAWLLIDEAAIRQAAGNPNGTSELPLPSVSELEGLPNPKQVLHDCLLAACELRGRRLDTFRRRIRRRVHRVANVVDDFSRLQHLSAFCAFQQSCEAVISSASLGV